MLPERRCRCRVQLSPGRETAGRTAQTDAMQNPNSGTRARDLLASSSAGTQALIDGMHNSLEILIRRGVLASVEHNVIGEVWKNVGLVCRDQANEFLL